MENMQSIIIAVVIVIAIFVGLFFAYNEGMLDPIIEKVGVMLFKAKAKAEQKKMEAQGMKMGDDFLSSQLKGNQEAEQVKLGMGSIGGLKKEN